jgi:hypothetical protein
MLAGIDLRLLAIIVTIGVFVYQNWRRNVSREAKQEMINDEVGRKIETYFYEQKEISKRLSALFDAQREVCQKRLELVESTYVRKDHFYPYLKPFEEQLRALVAADIPVELAKINVTQTQILSALKRLEDKIFAT